MMILPVCGQQFEQQEPGFPPSLAFSGSHSNMKERSNFYLTLMLGLGESEDRGRGLGCSEEVIMG